MDEDLYGIKWENEEEVDIKELPEGFSWLMWFGNNKELRHEVL